MALSSECCQQRQAFVDVVSRRDPTGTTTIRRAWRTEMRRRVMSAGRALERAVLDRDIGQAGYKSIIDRHLLGGASAWFKKHVADAYRSGLRYAHRQIGTRAPRGTSAADRAAIAKLTRQVERDLAGVSRELSKQITKSVRGYGIADRAMLRRIVLGRVMAVGLARSQTVASVNTTAAHAAATLATYQTAGVPGVGLMAETEAGLAWKTMGDDVVCEECGDMEGQVFAINEVAGMIPLHPNCRCAWIPFVET